jgi:hypothetical protein
VNSNPWVNSFKSKSRSPNSLHVFAEDFGIVGVPHGPTSPPRLNPNKEWKKSKTKTEDLVALVNSRFLREKEMNM